MPLLHPIKRFRNFLSKQLNHFGEVVITDFLAQLFQTCPVNHRIRLLKPAAEAEGKPHVFNIGIARFLGFRRRYSPCAMHAGMNAEASISTPRDGAKASETVLVADDSRAHRCLMCGTLRWWSFEPLEAEDGVEALTICQREDISLVVSDWMIPEMNGVESCREYRALMQRRPGHLILLTARTERELLAEGLESGADDFLSKPVSSVELRARLRAGLRVLKAQRDLASKKDEISRTLDQLSEAYAAVDSDLREARRFQEALVPDRHLSLDGTDISILYQTCGHVGGDMVGYFHIRESEIGIYAADVSGHGVGSALMSARIASYFSGSEPERNIALERTGSGFAILPPDEVCMRLNTLFQNDADSDRYFAMVLRACRWTEVRSRCVRRDIPARIYCASTDRRSFGGSSACRSGWSMMSSSQVSRSG
jgi:DNA-binding response OmpR family regulator